MSRNFVSVSVLILAAVLAVYFTCGCSSPTEDAPKTTAEQAGTGAAAAPPAQPVIDPFATAAVQEFKIMTWNLRGYPEKDAVTRQWFSAELQKLKPDVLCVQEIANKAKVDSFLAAETLFAKVAFNDSSDGQDNAIFTTSAVGMQDLPDPQGFQHPAQAAYVWSGGFDAVVVTVHLSWTNTAMREQEKKALKDVVAEALKTDPDVIVVGDFNTKEDGIQELAAATGLVVMVPAGQDGVGTTYAGNRYDHVLISPDLASEEAIDTHIEVFAGDDLAPAKETSDHMPVMARFRTEERFRDRRY
jgi:endonuclease/exonuclease/phosphatase family metal-dependent hydrolase